MSHTLRLAAAALVAALSGASVIAAQTPHPPEAIVPFTIKVPDAVLQDLKARLRNTRLPQEIPNTGWDYGTDLAYLRSLVGYWRDSFDWRAQERKLNALRSSRRQSTASRFILSTSSQRSLGLFRSRSRTAGRGRSSSSPRSSTR
jgi:hypothetical protein